MNKSKIRNLYSVSVIGYFIASVTVFLIPFSTGDDTSNSIIGILAGILFWMGLLAGTGAFGIVWKYLRNGNYKMVSKEYRPACITFFTKPIAFVSDIAMLCTIVLMILGNTVVTYSNILYLLLMFVFLFTFFIHFLFNGKIFRYIFLDYKRGE